MQLYLLYLSLAQMIALAAELKMTSTNGSLGNEPTPTTLPLRQRGRCQHRLQSARLNHNVGLHSLMWVCPDFTFTIYIYTWRLTDYDVPYSYAATVITSTCMSSRKVSGLVVEVEREPKSWWIISVTTNASPALEAFILSIVSRSLILYQLIYNEYIAVMSNWVESPYYK